MKIVFFIQGMKGGGAERVMSILCNTFSENGHEVILGITETMDDMAYELRQEVSIRNLTQCGKNVIVRRLQSLVSMRKLIKKEKPDVVISFITRTNILAIIAGALLKTPVIISERNDPGLDPQSKVTRLLRNIVYPFCSGCVFQTEYAKDYFKERLKKKSVVIPNPVTDEVLKWNDEKNKEKRIVTACRLEPQKNVEMLLEAYSKVAEENEEYCLDIYGKGSLEESLKKRIRELGIEGRARLMGHSSNIIEIMSKSEIFVLSSDYEGMPNSLIEAMCVGCACVATDAPAYGARQFIINGENGILVKVKDEEGMSEALKRLIVDEELRYNLGKNARLAYQIVDPGVVVHNWLLYIESICKK